MTTVTWRPLAPFGMEVDLDLAEPPSAQQADDLRDLLWRDGLLLFRSQQLTHEQQAARMSLFAPVLRSDDGYNFISTDETIGGFGRCELAFHSDLAFAPEPYQMISLLAIDVDARAPSTRFASSARLYHKLPEALRARLQSLRLLQAMPTNNATRQIGARVLDGMPCHTRPAIVPHYRTGEPIAYVTEMQAIRFEDVPAEESAALLREVFDCLLAPDNVFEHRWQGGDLIIWDNWMLQHARSPVIGDMPRTLQRVVNAPKGLYEQCPQLNPDDPAYVKWLNASEQTTGDAEWEAFLQS